MKQISAPLTNLVTRNFSVKYLLGKFNLIKNRLNQRSDFSSSILTGNGAISSIFNSNVLKAFLFALLVLVFTSTYAQTGQRCFKSPTKPIVWASGSWATNSSDQTVTVRITFSKTFVDNTYGTSAIGWPSGHTFNDLVGSDNLTWSLKDANGVEKLKFQEDYFSASTGFTSGYGTTGFNNDGNPPTVGNAADVVGFKTSLDVNFNSYGYILTTNSPATDANYTPNPSYPNWIYDVWYEVTVKLSAFGAAGFGYPDIASVHASPSKTGSNTELVNPVSCVGSIGNYVWNDQNGNGVQDSGEQGIQGVTVILTNPDATTVSTTTDASGLYQFTNLNSGTYSVTFPKTLTGNYSLTSSNIGANDSLDSDAPLATGIVAGITLAPGQTNNTIDAGYILSNLSLGNRVFYDKNRSGKYEATDEPIAYTTVHLYKDDNNDNVADGSFIGVTQTDVNGFYSFVNLAPGNYIVGAVIPAPLDVTVLNGGDPDNNVDEDNNAVKVLNGEATGLTITLSNGGEPSNGGLTNNTYDIGLYNPVLPPNGGKTCFSGTSTIVWAKSTWTANVNDSTVTIRTTFAKTFVDNTYGTNAVGWASGHKFGDLVGSDNLTWSLRDANGIEKLKFQQDYFSLDATKPSGYGTTGFNNDGNPPTVGLASDVLSFRTSMDVNFNAFNYILMTNSPVTDTSYRADPAYPNWIYDVWYEITVKRSAFGTADFGFPVVASVHASPSKTGNNTEIVTQTPCSDGMIGDYVWNDINGNGIQESGEPGISGVTVTLTKPDGSKVTAVTNANGYYLFNNLAQGNYSVAFSTPSGFVSTLSNQGTNDEKDSDPVNGSVTVTLGNGEANLTVDAGFFAPASIGDFVWNDINANGIQDSGEPGLSGVTVTLTYPNSATVTTTTDANGAYLFSNLAPGTYSLSFSAPSGFSATVSNAGANDAKDSDPVGGVVSGIVLSAGQANLTIDAGFYIPLGSIGDRVWDDINRNGIQDNGEVGVAGVTVSLYDNSGKLIYTTITGAYGDYIFANLPIASSGTNYQVRFSLPAAYQFSPKSQGGNGAMDSDPDITTGRTGNVTLTPANRDRTDIDAGIYHTLPARIGDFVWYDINANGIQDPNEPGIAGVTVTLYDNSGVPVATTITDNNGYYQFSDVNPGTYSIGISSPISFKLTTIDQGGDDTKDSDFDPVTFRTSAFTVVSGTFNMTFDAGLVPVQSNLYASIGDRVWNDLNSNGLQDSGEPGVSNVTVQLYNSVGVLIGTRTTDAYGYYIFNSLLPGSYYIKFSSLPSGYTLVSPNVGGTVNVAIDSDVDGANGAGTTPTYSLIAGELKVTVDAGIYNTSISNNSQLGDFVWYDLNKNGIQDVGEAGVPGVTALLYNASTGALIKSIVTDISGKYLFTDLSVGSYLVSFTNIPAGYAFASKDQGDDTKDSDVEPTNNRTGIYTISSDGTSILTVDAGIISIPNIINGKASIGDKVWNDLNNNGIQDQSETGVQNITVTLYSGNGTTVIASTTTDGLGNYIFNNLDAGNYVVGFSNLPGGYVFTSPNTGSNAFIDSDPNIVTGKTNAVTLMAGEINLTIDAGIYTTAPKSSLGDKVWFDANGNGIQDLNESGAGGVIVTLYDVSGNILKTTATSVNGYYLFSDLDGGSYVVGFSNLPVGYGATTQNILGSNTTNNSDADVVTLKTPVIILPAYTIDITWDLGIVSTLKSAVGDFVWSDINGNGIQDASEKGVAGITVTLYNNSGVPVSSTVTDANGYYLFSNLNPGTYSVGFSNLPVNAYFTTKNSSGSTSDNNSDVNVSTGFTDVFTLAPGQFKNDVDAGLITNFAAVGDYIWFDKKVNGKQDPDEIGVPGGLAILYDVAGNKVASAISNGNGFYLINNIPVSVTTNFTVGFSNMPIISQGFTIKNATGTTASDNSDASQLNGKTDIFTLQPSQIRLDIDAGIFINSGGPLPVSLVGFKGIYDGAVSKLSWSTESETNFNHFEIEYSKDGLVFSAIGNVIGRDNSNSKIDYSYIHSTPVVGNNYYRLKLINKDGSYYFSNVILLDVSSKQVQVINVYPNPFVEKICVSVNVDKSETVVVRLFDNVGKELFNRAYKVQKGSSVLTIENLMGISHGLYFIEVNTGKESIRRSVIK